MICIECGGIAINNTELCENCMETNRPEAMSLDMARQRDMSMNCASCQRIIFADSKQCSSCRKSYHISCDSSDAATLNGFVCSLCHRRSQILSDDMMLSASAAPLREQNAPLSPFSDPTVQQISLQMPTGPMTSSYPSSSDFGVDMYAHITASTVMHEQHHHHVQQYMSQSQLMDEISDGGATNDSDRNSSPFYQESSDYDEEFIPVSSRGRGRGSGGKKKPGRGQSTGSRRQTNPGPTGFFSATQVRAMGDFPQPTPTRGKRGKRGNGTATPRPSGKGPGRGRGRGRGSSTQISSVLQQVQYGSPTSMNNNMLHSANSHMIQMSSMGIQMMPSNPMFQSNTNQNTPPVAFPSSMINQPIPTHPVLAPLPESASSAVQNFQQPPHDAIREVDETMLEDENSRQSGGSRSDEAEYTRTAIICRANDEFLQKACMCLSCGSIGKGAEGSMVACSNCAQTYHTYCVHLHEKFNSAIMTRGWRCLDCTVCEGCGTGGDESKLILCEECDVSYHVYCLKPPLEKVPTGSWRCQWCSRCRRCNHKVASGSDLNPTGFCHPCQSLRQCPRCERGYQLNDKIIRCSQCSKWQHGQCEGLFTDEQLEQAAINRMRCAACRPNRIQNNGFSDTDTVWCDFVALDKDAHEILKSKYTPSALKNHMIESAGYRESFDHYEDDYTPLEDGTDQPGSSQPVQAGQRGRGRGNPSGRRGMNRIGVGGFSAKLPRHRLQALEEAAAAADEEDSKKVKRPRKPRRSQLEDAFPPQIQEAFFGIKAVEGKALVDSQVEEPALAEFKLKYKRENPTRSHELCMDAAEMLRNDINENEFLENMDFGNMDGDLNLDDMDFSLLIDEDEYNDELEDSLQGEMSLKEERPEGGYGPTTFNLDQKPSTSGSGTSGALGAHDGHQPGMNPANFAQSAPGVRTAMGRSGSQTDSADRYQFSARWEEDEPFGLRATTAAVLYANEKHPQLKLSHPVWSERVKQIQKLWRNLSSEERQEYVNRARDNRTKSGSKPRLRRTNAQSTNSVDSPTIHSPAPHQFGFKVPTNPGEQSVSTNISTPSTSSSSSNMFGSSGQPKQVVITCHLNMKDFMHYQELKRVKHDREKLNGSLEEQLNKARKQKKNLAAKKRQMVKTQMAAPDYDGREIDLNDSDQQILAQLTDHIKTTQSDLENSRRDLKTHEGLLRSFETQKNIIRMESSVAPALIEQSRLRDQEYEARAELIQAQRAQAQGLGQMPHQGHSLGAQSLPLLQQQHHQHRMMQMQGMMRPPPNQFMIRQQGSGAPTMALQNQQEMHRRMMQQIRQPRPVLGGVRYDEITDPAMKDAYECLEAILFDVHSHIEGNREGHHQTHGPPPPHIIQRMMHHPGAPGPPGPRLIMPGHLPPGQIPQLLPGPPISQQPPMTPQSAQPTQLSEDGPKPKKKRTTQKKAASAAPTVGEFDTWIGAMRARFRLCDKIPKVQREPRLNRPGCEFVKFGLTEMAVVRQRKPLIGVFGEMRVNGGTRLFGNVERTQKVLQFNDVNLYQVEPQIRLVALYNNPKPVAEDTVFQDDMDEKNCLNPNAVLEKLFNKRQTSREHVRSRAKYMDEAKAPLEPERSIFYEERGDEEDVTVELVFNTNDITQESSLEDKKDLCYKLHEQIRDLLAIKDELPWKMEDTPPESPVSITPEPDVSEGIRQTTSTSRAPSASVEKEIKREEEDDMPAAPVFREIKKEVVDSSQPHQCKHCNSVIEGGATPDLRFKMDKFAVLPVDATNDEREEMVSFCTKKCYYEFLSISRAALTQEELEGAEQHVCEETLNKLKQVVQESILKAISQGKKPPVTSTSSSSLLGTAELISPCTRYTIDEVRRENVTVVPVSSLIGSSEAKKEMNVQRVAAGVDWKPYTQEMYDSFISIMHQHQQFIFSPKLGVPHPPHELDKRLCVFCGGVGDGETARCGRLISLTEYYWVHVNCALWSAEVFESPSGYITNVDRAVIRAAQTACDHCKRPGASVKCHKMNCGVNYHVLCAMQSNGYFIKDRTFICKLHEKVPNQAIVYRLDAIRKIFIKRDENSILTRLFDLSDGPTLCLRIGAFTFYKLGSITPKQIKRFHNKDYIFPNKYRATRLFWSPRNYRDRMMFECTIEDYNNQPLFVVKSLEDPSICCRASSATKAWMPIYERVNQLREQQQGEQLKFFGSQICGETLFGLNENAITKITESLPGFDTIFTYQNRHQDSPVLELPLAENQMGCARAEPRNRTVGQHFRTKPQPMGGTHHNSHGVIGLSTGQSSQASVVSSSQNDTFAAARQASTSVTSANSGRTRGVRSYYTEEAAARARAFGISPDLASLSLRMETTQNAQTAFSAYQKMRREWKERVYLARSRIAGLGLYAKSDISMGEYIIEYKGEIIRSEVCEVREVRYTVQNRGVYMFRIDEEWVIDATMAGGPARYINHSCDPNCSTQILDAGSGAREKKIIITANRPISSNEELTYDYQFELEGTTDKIPCLCGAPNCVKWMN